MKRILHLPRALALSMLVCLPGLADDAAIERELDAYWNRAEQYLAAGDFGGVVSIYHPDAVLVSEPLGTSYPITRALERWKPGILDTKAGKAKTTVKFRITRRLYSASTAHERGIFLYTSTPVGDGLDSGDMEARYVHFEALLLKSDGWKMVMEYQKQPATREEWDAAEAAGGSAPAM